MSDKAELAHKRILLKLSGEALMGNESFGIDPVVLERMASEVKAVRQLGVQIGIVVGGGNLFRGERLAKAGMNRVAGDHMGMLATVMNSLAMQDALERIKQPTRVMSAISLTGVCEDYDRRFAIRFMEAGNVVIFCAGTGNPFFTTDTAACLRGIEIEADLILKATKVDGVYSADPMKYPEAVKYNRLTYSEALERELGVMDLTAFCLARDHDKKIRVLNMTRDGALLRAVKGEDEGTLIEK
ncbi:UMP kinase [Permianibacter aggregans]|uniref:Uridylate kinase n=1 Tax=Permianibacter aggregans TaxID=1510150 RepID=A0A4V3D866_9GAMM|nr:UMP kinase [Permianibacter aggregans]QGX38735.1 UMP kinase [Permianibacter aggregans]TDQ50537.1 uridylate kinase [Permianibacter aggregans]